MLQPKPPGLVPLPIGFDGAQVSPVLCCRQLLREAYVPPMALNVHKLQFQILSLVSDLETEKIRMLLF